MKKALIAGAASAVLAAMPVFGAFATLNTTLTDTLSIEVPDNCALTYKSTAHTNGASKGTWTDNTLSATLDAGTASIAIGKSYFNVTCNNQAGWHVTAAPESLTSTTENSTNRAIPNASANSDGSVYNFTATKTNGSDNSFTIGAANATNLVTMSAATDTTGKDFEVEYTVTIGATQAADTYEGDIVYTLVKGPASN